ncbi:MAG: 50S ribosomal protein L30e [Promethearchaeota archaeon]|jgi:large subunit ribosomal protein L30e|nr:MAG: 50S ribosomal protein L30e [Candidatus Lokiarchaeota archaeon]
MARKKKQISESIDLSRKKTKEFDIDTNIKVAYKTGKVVYGADEVLRQLRQNSFKMLITSNNCPAELESELKYLNSLMKESIFIHKYKGSSWDLGLAMGKPYMISLIGINDFGDSDLTKLKTKRN